MSLIEIEGLAKSYRVYQKQEGLWASLRGLVHREYRDVNAVRGIDLRVEQGEFVAFLWPNGAGKTTTLKLLSGVINPSAGTARVMGHVPWKRENSYRRRFAREHSAKTVQQHPEVSAGCGFDSKRSRKKSWRVGCSPRVVIVDRSA